jgi:hypothetical protein
MAMFQEGFIRVAARADLVHAGGKQIRSVRGVRFVTGEAAVEDRSMDNAATGLAVLIVAGEAHIVTVSPEQSLPVSSVRVVAVPAAALHFKGPMHRTRTLANHVFVTLHAEVLDAVYRGQYPARMAHVAAAFYGRVGNRIQEGTGAGWDRVGIVARRAVSFVDLEAAVYPPQRRDVCPMTRETELRGSSHKKVLLFGCVRAVAHRASSASERGVYVVVLPRTDARVALRTQARLCGREQVVII